MKVKRMERSKWDFLIDPKGISVCVCVFDIGRKREG